MEETNQPRAKNRIKREKPQNPMKHPELGFEKGVAAGNS
jgi:hypothetical protein